jgi:hypothetical protein
VTIRDLECKGVVLTPKLTYRSTASLDAKTLAHLKVHKAELLRDLVMTSGYIAPNTLPRLPWQLEALLRALPICIKNGNITKR